MKKIVLGLIALGLCSNVVMAKEIKYQCLIAEIDYLDSNTTVKFSEKEMRDSLFTFKQNTVTNTLIDPDGTKWTYSFTNSGLDYYGTKGKKGTYFLLSDKDEKIKDAGMYTKDSNYVFKGYCNKEK